MNKLILIALLAASPLAMAEETFWEKTQRESEARRVEREARDDQFLLEQRLQDLENRQRRMEREEESRRYMRLLRDGNDTYGRGN